MIAMFLEDEWGVEEVCQGPPLRRMWASVCEIWPLSHHDS